MRNLNELNINPIVKGLTQTEIETLEKSLNLDLPMSYKSLLMHSSGGHPELDTIQFLDGGSVAIDRFLEPNDAPGIGLIWYHKILSEKFAISQKILPFATDGGNNLFCLNLIDPNPKVVMIFHSKPNNVPLVIAQDFEAFLNKLEVNADYM